MSIHTEEDPTKLQYVELITQVTAFDATKEPLRIISAVDMLGMCNAFLGATRCHISDRLPLSKESRRELGRKVEWNIPTAGIVREEWSVHVQNALQILSRRDRTNQISPLDQWQTWEDLETDIHIAVRCTRLAVEFYRSGDPQHLPLKTELFAVPEAFPKFVSSIISGEVRPVWMWDADAAKTPKCADGFYPRYALLK